MTDSDKKSLVELIDRNGNSYGMRPIYEISKIFGGFPNAIMNNSKNIDLKNILVNDYLDKYTRFNMTVDFSLREYGWKIVNPLLNGKDDVLLYYQGKLMLVSNSDYFLRVLANKDVEPIMVFPKLSDEEIGFIPNNSEKELIGNYLKDSKGFINIDKIGSKEETVLLMAIFEMLGNRAFANEYVNSKYYKENDLVGFYMYKKDISFVKTRSSLDSEKEEYEEFINKINIDNQSKEIEIKPIMYK